MDADILTAIWFECKDLSDIERTLLQALAFHCHNSYTCWPSVGRLSIMIRRTERHTRRLLRILDEMSYISTEVQRGRNHSNLYTINRTRICPVSEKIGHGDVRSKSDMQVSPEFKEEEERKKEGLLRHLGLEEGSEIWIASMNGHGREIPGS